MPNPRGQEANELWRISGLGIEFVGIIAGMTVLGWFADKWLGTGPWLLLTGVFIGLIGGGVRFARDAQRAARRANEAYRRDHGPSDKGA